ncbi:hypothetical protein WN944_006458 [Citrus x changshan-huyou]|uniref:Large ribosomal subunit protein uL15/eL18 domain-containing protein n=1 Tax=Citrus x changshan-huyou TaxID=2935761 RepID=A0AAP0MJ70_9ROSI
MTAAHVALVAAAQQSLSLSPSLVTISPSGLNCCRRSRVQPSPSCRPPEKVLGKGLLLENQLVVVKAKLVSKIAKKKLKKAGGSVVFTASMIQNLGIEESEVSESINYDFDNGDYHRWGKNEAADGY